MMLYSPLLVFTRKHRPPRHSGCRGHYRIADRGSYSVSRTETQNEGHASRSGSQFWHPNIMGTGYISLCRPKRFREWST
ncbi:MAG: hypothetical protein ACYTFG_00315 [Planctomycetota bacterium]